ncbi:MAG: hybrid sensor histidine kinase/response regulator [Desulfuromonadales bacterium]
MLKDTTKYKVFFENSADAMLVIENGVFVDCNQATVAILGYDSKAEVIHTQPFKLSPEFQHDGCSSFAKAVEMMQLAKDRGNHRFEWEHLRKDGSVLPVEVSLTAIESEHGTQLHTVWRDISKRKLAEEELLESREKYKKIFEHLQEVYYETAIDGTVLEVSPSAETLSGYTREELIGKSFLDFYVYPEERQVLMDRVLEKGKVKDFKVYLKDKHGTQHLCLTTVILINDNQGKPVKLIGSMRDISDIERTEELLQVKIKEYETSQQLLRESEERLKALNEASFGGILIHDNGHILDCNQRLSEMTGFCHEELVGMNSFELIAPDWLDLVKRNFEKGYDKRYEVEGVRKDGSVYPLAIRGKIIPYKGHAVRMVELRDVTERKKAEAELQKMERLKNIGVLAGGIAHDFNNILTGLYGNITLAKMKLAHDHPGFRFLATAEESMHGATLLTSQLLTFAKGGEPVKESLDLGLLVKEAVNFNLTGSNVKPVFTLADSLWLARADHAQILQVFANLTTNARQAMPAGGHLHISMENAEVAENTLGDLDGGKYLRITVSDEGTGIAPEHLARIFDPYFTTKQAGNGLGLATAQSIINRHGGQISATSQLGKGTTFTIYLPASESAELSLRQAEAASASINEVTRVLVMDDEEMICRLLQEMLTELGFTVETAAEGRQAIEMYRQAMLAGHPFAVVIVDLTVSGGMGGQETAQGILQIDPGARIIVSSGYADDPVMANYADYGFRGIAPKPYRMAKLSAELDKVMGNS